MRVVSIFPVVDLPAPFGPRHPNTPPLADRQVNPAYRFHGAAAAAEVFDKSLSFHCCSHESTL